MGQQHEEPELIGLTGVLLSSDSLKPIPDAEVFSRENILGTFTDSKGRFTIAVVIGDTLLFSSLGYADKMVAINDSILSLRPPARFYMSLDTIRINEVVIRGYWDYRTFKQKIINMKIQTHPFDVTEEMEKNPLLYKQPNTGFTMEGPVQLLYDMFNSSAVLQRQLVRNRRAYNKRMIKMGLAKDTIPSTPDYMREKQH
ncbi:MAG: carboxypeptidase-like regulatory domain-containing protein [Bacteroidales bacterium]|nr:carboxypeptidase-like regulatory domain-containing protein [Bacteroidales bacterium]